MTPRTGRIAVGVLIVCALSVNAVTAGLFDAPAKPASPPPRSAPEPPPPPVEPPGKATTLDKPRPAPNGSTLDGPASHYREAVRKAKADYYQALLAADQVFLDEVTAARKAAITASDDAAVQRLDADAAAAAERVREHQAALASVRAGARPQLVSATFGTSRVNQWADVTDVVRKLTERPDTVRVSPDLLGDPASGWRKKLQIVYVQDGEQHTVAFNEDDEIRIEGLIPALPHGQ